MKRRQFVFRSLQSAALFSPILSWRLAEAAGASAPKRLFCFIDAGTPYVKEEDIFPIQPGSINTLPHNLSGFSGLENDMVIVNGCSYDQSDHNIGGNWHVSGMGQCLTASIAKDVGNTNGAHTGPSIDFVVSQALNVRSHVCNVSNKNRAHMRNRPFASTIVEGTQTRTDFNLPFITPFDAWNNLFGSFESSPNPSATLLNRLKADKSILDATLQDLQRLSTQLTGNEKLKLDIHLDAIRKAEKSIQQDMEMANQTQPSCTALNAPNGTGDRSSGAVDVMLVPQRSKAHFDILFAGFSCQLIGVGGLILGYSGEDDEYSYRWVDGVQAHGDFHADVWHAGVGKWTENKLAARWQWGEFAKFCQRLKQTPEGNGNMLDNVLCYGTSHFGKHHTTTRIPVVYVGNAQGDLATGRYIYLPTTKRHCQALTSVAHLMGVPATGMGQSPNCGTLSELGLMV